VNKKQTIVIVAHDVGGLGGMERHLEEVILRLKKDMNVVVAASSMQLRDAEGVRFVRIPSIKRPFPLMMLLFAFIGTIRLLFVKRDLLHTTGAIVFNRADYSTIHFCHDGFMRATGDTRARNNRSFLFRLNSSIATQIALRMEKMIYKPKRTEQLVAVSKRVKGELLDAFPYEKGQVPVIPNGVDIEKFVPFTDDVKFNLRKRFGVPERGRVLLFMGGDWPRKGLDDVIQSFNEIAGEFPDTCLLVVGTGNKAEYAARVHANHRDRVIFTGRQPNPQEWFGISDVFIAPSSYETFSLVVHEAAAAGLTILSTRVGGVEDFIDHMENGLFIERNSDSISGALRTVLANFEAFREYGVKAREKVEALTWDNTYRRFMALYGEKRIERKTPHPGIGSNEIGHHPSASSE
jgi:glycosyltransferase involved in cell wall biosynthesis